MWCHFLFGLVNDDSTRVQQQKHAIKILYRENQSQKVQIAELQSRLAATNKAGKLFNQEYPVPDTFERERYVRQTPRPHALRRPGCIQHIRVDAHGVVESRPLQLYARTV